MDQNRRYENLEVNLIATLLYSGGWRAEDRNLIIEEYGFTEENVDLICNRLRDIAEWEEEEEEDI